MVSDFDTVRKLARELGPIDHLTDSVPAIKVNGKLLAWIPPHKSTESGTLAVRLDIDRTDLIAAAPDVYYLTEHYLNYPTVLVRLSRIHPDALKDLLRMALTVVNRKPPKSKKPLTAST